MLASTRGVTSLASRLAPAIASQASRSFAAEVALDDSVTELQQAVSADSRPSMTSSFLSRLSSREPGIVISGTKMVSLSLFTFL